MVVVSFRELFSYYVLILKLREEVRCRLLFNSSTTISLDFAQQSPSKVQTQQQQPFNSLQIVEKNDEESCKNKKSPESDWVISIREELKQADQKEKESSWAKLRIYRVPHYLSGSDDKVFVPQILSLGPYHHRIGRLCEMETHKLRCLNHFLKRHNQDVKIYLDAMKKLEKRARECYQGSISLSSDEFAEMMVLDGCFVLELFLGTAVGFQEIGYSENDPIFASRATMNQIQRDMIMLENQIPIFILDRLLGLQLGNPIPRGIVEKLTLAFFDPLVPTDKPLTQTGRNRLELSLEEQYIFDLLWVQNCLHCLDVYRRSLLRHGPIPEPRKWMRRLSSTERVADKRRQQLIHCVTQLKEAGINFKRSNTDRFWDIKFKNGVLQIPRLLIHEGTKSLLLNLIAFEQCHLNSSNDITSYVVFMDNLINSKEDVGYLHCCGIIEHWLGSDAEVADLFNRLHHEVVYDRNDSYLSGVSEQVNKYYNLRWNGWRASLKHKYFNNPWTIISLLAAFLLLMLTSAQTFYQIFPYYRPK